MDDDDELSAGPESVLCNPADVAELPEKRPVRGFSVYAGRHVQR